MNKLGSHLFWMTAQQFISGISGLIHTNFSGHGSGSNAAPARDVLNNRQDLLQTADGTPQSALCIRGY